MVSVGVAGLAVRLNATRPSLGLTGLALGFCAFLVAGCLQLAPMPLVLISRISPETVRVIRQLDFAVASGLLDRHPVSIAPALTLTSLILFVSNAILLFGCARLFSARGARRTAEAIAVLGVALALTGIIQSRFFTGRIYGFWLPLEGASPFGPFVNRNHFAGWMLMALPLTLGLLLGGLTRARTRGRPSGRERLMWFSSTEASRLILLAGSALVMAVALVLTMSRSGMSAFALAIVLTGTMVARRLRSGRRTVAAGYLLSLVIVAIWWVGAGAVASRFGESRWNNFNDRRGAWADAIDIARKFPMVGTGLNTYGVSTLLFQRHDLSRHYEQAHNDFLQLAAEGGLLLTIPAALCLGLLVVLVRRRFVDDVSERTYWLRVGAVTGLIAIAFQETVDFSLQMPGNAALFAVLCAIALHRPEAESRLVSPTGPAPSRRRWCWSTSIRQTP
jgi:putative inorganic carbon (HCO3(-)) transporter